MMTIEPLELQAYENSNAFYAAINDRFDARADYLRSKGFRYHHVAELPIAVFIKGAIGYKPQVIQAATVMHACDHAWKETIARI